VPDAPDPLGKRALFWAPAERQEHGPRTQDEDAVPGKHALFSNAGSATVASGGRARVRPSDAEAGPVDHLPSRRRAVADGGRRDSGPVADLGHLERPSGSGMFGSLTLQCSSCRVRSQVDLVEFVVLHLPLWLWRPGRGYTRFMTCPACRRRTWISASWRR
jgi:hypothetical protein